MTPSDPNPLSAPLIPLVTSSCEFMALSHVVPSVVKDVSVVESTGVALVVLSVDDAPHCHEDESLPSRVGIQGVDKVLAPSLDPVPVIAMMDVPNGMDIE